MTDISKPKSSPEQVNLQELRVRRDSPAGSRDVFLDLKQQLEAEIVAHADPGLDLTDRGQVRPFVHNCLDDLLVKMGIVLNKNERRQLLDAIVADLTDRRS